MNLNKKISARFQPKSPFETPPAPAVPFRANLETQFEQLKNQLLADRLKTSTKAELTVLLRRAANEAAALAWISFYPLLVFPALFEEKSLAIERQIQRQARVYANSRELVIAE